MEGQIIKAIAGFYYVKVKKDVYECKAKGNFKNENITPLVGDFVEMEVLDAGYKYGYVTEIKPRKNELKRPAVANVDQVLVVFAVKNPNPNFSLLDRFIAQMKAQNVPVIICFNKRDLGKSYEFKAVKEAYKKSGCKVFFTAAGSSSMRYLMPIKMSLRGKTTVMAGPSGVGKSTLLNAVAKVLNEKGSAQTGAISERTGRGKNTTRHTELFSLPEGIRIIDTPGFTALVENTIPKKEIKNYFPEFAPFESQCPFKDCLHIKERDCAVVKAVAEGKIPQSRYNAYKSMVSDAKENYEK